MTASPAPRSQPTLEAFGEELKCIAEDLSDELALTKITLTYQPPIEALDVPRAVVDVWIDGDHEAALAAERRLNEEARALEQRTALPWRTAGIIPHWHV